MHKLTEETKDAIVRNYCEGIQAIMETDKSVDIISMGLVLFTIVKSGLYDYTIEYKSDDPVDEEIKNMLEEYGLNDENLINKRKLIELIIDKNFVFM